MKSEVIFLKVLVHTKLKNGDQEITFDLKGIYQEEEDRLVFKENKNTKITLFLKEKIFLRETEEAILSYKFGKKNSRFEVYLKDLKKTGVIGLETKKITVKDHCFEVCYQIEGNGFDHFYQVEWR